MSNQDIGSIIQELQLYHKACHRLAVTFKALDLGIDAVRVYYMPTAHNVADVVTSGAHLLSMTTGVTKFSIAVSAVSVGYTYYKGGRSYKISIVSAAFMAVPYSLAFTGTTYWLSLHSGVNHLYGLQFSNQRSLFVSRTSLSRLPT